MSTQDQVRPATQHYQNQNHLASQDIFNQLLKSTTNFQHAPGMYQVRTSTHRVVSNIQDAELFQEGDVFFPERRATKTNLP